MRSIAALDYNKNFEDYQIQIQEEATKFATEKLAPFSAEWDAKSHFPVDVFKESADLGFAGIYTSEAGGGTE